MGICEVNEMPKIENIFANLLSTPEGRAQDLEQKRTLTKTAAQNRVRSVVQASKIQLLGQLRT
ncbi:MAG: hypothetical protein ACJAZW_000144 [Maritalea sp.]|jgi:hypothetical protein